MSTYHGVVIETAKTKDGQDRILWFFFFNPWGSQQVWFSPSHDGVEILMVFIVVDSFEKLASGVHFGSFDVKRVLECIYLKTDKDEK